MNLYFFSTEQTEVTFPVNDLSTNITNSIRTIDELKKNPDINDLLNKTDDELTPLYKKYKAKTFHKTRAQKKLNEIKVYLIVKSKIVKGEKVMVAIPIRNYDDLGNSVLEKSKGLINSLFHVRHSSSHFLPTEDEGIPVSRAAMELRRNRPFFLGELQPAQSEDEIEIPLKALKLPKDYDIDGNKIPYQPLPRAEYGYLDPSLNYQEEYLEKIMKYDYTYSMFDKTVILNVARYTTDSREKKSFCGPDGKAEHLLDRLKKIDLKEISLKQFDLANVLLFLLNDKSHLIDKNIIPVFSELGDAQDLLITVLEEVNQPFQVRRRIETANTPKYSRSLEYLDDSFTFQNHDSRSDFTNEIIGFLKRYISIILNDPRTDNDYYSEDKYQTKGPFHVPDPDMERHWGGTYRSMSKLPEPIPKCIWRESDYSNFIRLYFPGQPEAYSWLETRSMTRIDKRLLQTSQDVKIVSMGLNDFLEFWNNHHQKNADVLFIPSSDYLNKEKLPLLSKKPRDRFYDYQQKYRGSKKYDTDNYSYDIKLSS